MTLNSSRGRQAGAGIVINSSRGTNNQYGANLRTHANILIGFLIGILVGRNYCVQQSTLTAPRSLRSEKKIHGSIHRLNETPIRNTFHKDKSGQSVTKQQFLEPFAVPTISGYSVATLHPGQNVDVHEHESMHEFFYILEGMGIFLVGEKELQVSPGTFLHFSPHESHGIVVPKDSPGGDLKILLSGVVIEN